MSTFSLSLLRLAVLAACCSMMPAFGAVVPATFDSATTVPVTAATYSATGNTVDLALGFAPATGIQLTVVENTGLAFIEGSLGNLAQGQQVKLTYNGISYTFVADCFGGTGNDLVLKWADMSLFSWGYNNLGQLGNGTTSNRPIPGTVDQNRVLAGKLTNAMAAARSHGLALCADGTLAAWGSNSAGQLGDGSTVGSSVPVVVDRSGVLAGKSIIAIAAGGDHSLARCADGALVAWGDNSNGQLSSFRDSGGGRVSGLHPAQGHPHRALRAA